MENVGGLDPFEESMKFRFGDGDEPPKR